MFKFIGRIFHFLWRLLTVLRVVLLNLVFLVVLVLLVKGFSSAPDIQIADNSALVLMPSGNLVDKTTYEPDLLQLMQGGEELPGETDVHVLIDAVKLAAGDDAITGLILKTDFLEGGGMSKIEELGQAINYFKNSGKPVIAVADQLNQQQYLLASYADEIIINPLGGVYLTGFGVYRNYFRELADKLHLKFHVFRVGEFKDAVEPFTRSDMSEASREHNMAMINQFWQRYTGIIETHRELETGSLDALVKDLDQEMVTMRGDAAKLALDKGLIDAVMSRSETQNTLKQRFGVRGKKEELNAIGVDAYLSGPSGAINTASHGNIGLIVAQGDIVDGHQPENRIGADSLSELIRKARRNTHLKALVVRIDSGGGSAFASEVIREELAAAQAQGLPVYISMGSVAASGGYWMSTSAKEVWATPATLTGSIGVFALIPNLSESLGQVGVETDGFGTSPLASSYRIDVPMTEETGRVIQASVDNIYQRFLQLVAQARASTPEAIHEIAQGRVWSGESAKQLGLVDKLGSLEDLYAYIASEYDIEDILVESITRDLSPREQFLRALLQESAVFDLGIKHLFGEQAAWLGTLKHLDASEPALRLMNTSLDRRSQWQTYASCWFCQPI